MNNRRFRRPALPPRGPDHQLPEPDPSTWPGLMHRLTRSAKDAMRLLLVVFGVLASLVGAVLVIASVLDVSLLQLGFFGIERAP